MTTLPAQPDTQSSPHAADVNDRGITVAEASGMLAALRRGHECTYACTGEVTLGDGATLTLTCPYERLDPEDPTDRRIIGSIYAIEARAALIGGRA